MKPRAAHLILLGGALAASIVLAEIALRVALPAGERYDVWEPGLRLVFRPVPGVMPGVSGDARFFVNSEGVRGDEPSPDHRLVLLALGGSTTECLYLDQDESWPMRLQGLLARHHGFPVRVGNAGRSGMTTKDHVLHLRRLIPRFERVGTILALTGVNDLALRLEQDESYRPGAPADPAHAFVRRGAEGTPFWERTGLHRLYERVRAKEKERTREGLIHSLGGESYDGWRARRRGASEWRRTLPDLRTALDEYESNLREMARLATEAGKRIVFLTQPAIWRDDLSPAEDALLWFGWVGDRATLPPGPYYTAGAMREGIDAYNARLLQVCRREALDCFDLASRIPRTTAAFYDDVHFNENGAALTARAVFAHLTGR